LHPIAPVITQGGLYSCLKPVAYEGIKMITNS